jgi:hypothetical protein
VDSVAAACGEQVDGYGYSHGGIVAARRDPDRDIRKLHLYEGWPITDPSITHQPAHDLGAAAPPAGPP